MAIQNLPRSERYTSENVLLIGVIPGPHEAKKTVNTYLKPLVNELLELWKGIIMLSSCSHSSICTSCDIPASRKVSGFVGYSAYCACSRCLKPFSTEKFWGKADYSGTDRASWTPRSIDSHRKYALQYKSATTQQHQKLIEREHRCRYSVLLELPYYDVIRFCVIDPMHNLLLGTVKHMLSD